jgi:KUP system potassium uptake protein
MYVWYRVTNIKADAYKFTDTANVLPQLQALSRDNSLPLLSANLVYLTASNTPDKMETKIAGSIFDHQPKRAEIYWFVHVEVQDDPFTTAYDRTIVAPEDMVYIRLKLGFRIAPKIQFYLQKIMNEMVDRKEVQILPRYGFSDIAKKIGDTKFVVIQNFLSNQNDLGITDTLILNVYFLLNQFSLSGEKEYSIDDCPSERCGAHKIELMHPYSRYFCAVRNKALYPPFGSCLDMHCREAKDRSEWAAFFGRWE